MNNNENHSHTFVIAVFDQVIPSAVMGIRDLLGLGTLAHEWKPLAKNQEPVSGDKLRILVATPGGENIIDGQGNSINVDTDLLDISKCDAILVPGFMPTSRGRPPEQSFSSATKSWFQNQHRKGAIVGGSCSGVFALGEAGLLNGRRCTTTWWLHDVLEQKYPRANVAWASALIDDDRVITAGGPLSWVDITLQIVTTLLGSDHAKITADFSVIDTDPKSKTVYMPEGYLLSKDQFVLKTEQLIRQNQFEAVNAEGLADALSVSSRTLQRRIKKITGESPKELIDRVRLDQACTLLRTSRKSIKEIALSLGYSDDAVFRRLFRNKLSVSPTQYRKESV